MKFTIKIYSFINMILEKIWFKLDYIWAHRYHWIKDLGIVNLIDVWANKGQTIAKYKKIWNNSLHIYSFEPLTSAFDILTQKYWKDEKVSLYKMWLWIKQESLMINIYTHDDSSSILQASKDGQEIYHYITNDSEIIKVETLDNIFCDWLQWPIMMKIDVQWYELNVLKGAEQFIRSVSIVILELSFVELYQWQELFGEIHDWLRVRWFEYSWSLEQASKPIDGKPLQQDAYFINQHI